MYCKNLPKKGLDFAKLCVFPNFYPNLPIFLHGYIRHIRDILQLWIHVDIHTKLKVSHSCAILRNKVCSCRWGSIPAHKSQSCRPANLFLRLYIHGAGSAAYVSIYLQLLLFAQNWLLVTRPELSQQRLLPPNILKATNQEGVNQRLEAFM